MLTDNQLEGIEFANGIRRYLGAMADELDDLHIESEEVVDAGDQVVATSRISGRGRSSGAPVELVMTTVGAHQDGMIIRMRNFADKAEALDAAGLVE
jgi:ketosteroid isomerase-like protein